MFYKIIMCEIMYSYIKRKIIDIQSDYIVIDNNGISYLIYNANPYSFTIDKEETIYINML